MKGNLIQDHPRQNTGPWLPKSKSLDDYGRLVEVMDQERDQGVEPSLKLIYGVLWERTVNERNRRRSRLERHLIDTEDLFEHQVKDRFKFQELGGGYATQTRNIVNAVDGLPAPTTNSLLLRGSTVEHLGRAHGERVDVTVDAWSQFTQKEWLKHPKAGGNKLLEQRHVLADGTAVPDTANTIEAWNEYLDDESVVQVVQSAPNGFGTLDTVDNIDAKAQGEDSTTETTTVDLPYSMPAPTYLTLDQTLKDLGNGRGEYTVVTADAFPPLVGYVHDKATDALIKITRQVVSSGVSPVSTPPIGSVADGDVKEIQPLDKLRSISIRSQFVDASGNAASPANTGSPIVIPATFQYRFPAVLTDVNIYSIWAFAQTGGNYTYDEDFAFIPEVEEAQNGTYTGRILQIFTYSPEAVMASYPAVNFVAESVTVRRGNYAYYASSKQVWADAHYRTWSIPPTLHAEIDVTMNNEPTGTSSITIGSSTTSTILATSITALPTGTYITIGTNSIKQKLGLYEVQVKQVLCP